MKRETHMWRSEDNLEASPLAFYHVGLRVKLKSSGLKVNDFTHGAISLVPGKLKF